jgi:chromosome segregation ATPase
MDIERTMQFIVEQQAQFWASVQKHDEQIAELRVAAAKHDEQIAKSSEQIATLTDLVGRLAQAEIRLTEQMQGHEARLSEQLQGHEARLASLETKATQLFERMDRFIQGFEGNGHKPQSS